MFRSMLTVVAVAAISTAALAEAPEPPPPANVAVKFTEPEVQALINLMDAAVRANGLRSAGNAAILSQKLQDALTASKPAAPAPQEKKP